MTSLIELLASPLSQHAGKWLVIRRRPTTVRNNLAKPFSPREKGWDEGTLGEQRDDFKAFPHPNPLPMGEGTEAQPERESACTKGRQFATRQAECKVDTAGMTN
jgi:hypothetical protein